MSSSSTKINIQLAAAALAIAAVASGCHSGHESSYSTTAAPITYGTGGTGSDTQYQSGSGSSTAQYQPEAEASGSAQTATEQGSAQASAQGGTEATLAQGQGGAEGNQIQVRAPEQTGTNVVIPLHQETVQVGKRTVDAGTVRIQKKVTTQTVNQPVELRSESVTVDRQPATGQSAQAQTGSEANQMAAGQAVNQPFQQGEIVIHLQREEPVVQKQIVPSGNVVARVQPQTKQENIQSQVRREEVAVNTQGNPQNVTVSPNVRSGIENQGAAMGGGGTAGAGGQGQGAGASTGGAATITDLRTLTMTSSPATLAGKQVQLNGVQVQQVIGDRLIAVGTPGSKPIYVRLQQPANFTKGDRINLTGTVNEVPSSPASMGLGDEEAQALQNQPVYIDAQQAQPAR